MHDAADTGPPVELAVAYLIVSPEEVLRPDARQGPQCLITDCLITKSYDATARMGRIGNSLSHLIMALITVCYNIIIESSKYRYFGGRRSRRHVRERVKFHTLIV